MKKIIVLLAGLVSILCVSCADIRPYSNNPEVEPTVRAKVIESGTITYCKLTNTQKWVMQVGDTVWLDITQHCIDDTSNNTMKVVLQ